MVVSAVELFLDKFDRRISDRYKLIGYKEDDFQKEIVYFSSDYFAHVTIPIVLSKYSANLPPFLCNKISTVLST